MGKHRAITGFGPLELRSTATGATAWIRFGPFLGNQLAYQGVWSHTSAGAGTAKVQGTLTTGSTKGVVTLVTRSSTATAMLKSTSALVFAFIRFNSTAMAAGKSVTHVVAAVQA